MDWLLHHDNAPTHTVISVQWYLTKNMTMIPLPFFTDLAPTDFFLYLRPKLKLKGNRFDDMLENKNRDYETGVQDMLPVMAESLDKVH
jgi:hypothetical protein